MFIFLFVGDGSHETEFDMNAGPSNPDESTDQVPQGKLTFWSQMGMFARRATGLIPETILVVWL